MESGIKEGMGEEQRRIADRRGGGREGARATERESGIKEREWERGRQGRGEGTRDGVTVGRKKRGGGEKREKGEGGTGKRREREGKREEEREGQERQRVCEYAGACVCE